jgi:ABC-type dipeptide/oligopeptide/nickel transport system permease component
MRTRWKLAGLVAVAIAVIVAGLLLSPSPLMFQVKVEVMPATGTPEPYDQSLAWINHFLPAACGLAVVGVLAWVTQHVLRRPRAPDA